MKRSKQILLIVLSLATMLVLIYFSSKTVLHLAPERINIPDTNLTIQKISGLEIIRIAGLFLSYNPEDPAKLPTFSITKTDDRTSVRSAPVTDVLSRIFSENYEKPEHFVANGIDIYISKMNDQTLEIDDTAEGAFLVKAVILSESESVEFNAFGLPSTIESVFEMSIKMLSSVEQESK